MSERRFDPANIAKLDSPERRKTLPPEKILTFLTIEEKNDILDLGSGSGYFTLPAAKMSKGTMYALDVEAQMLEVLKERVTEQGLGNVQYIQGVIEDIPMEDEKIERVIASLVLHEVEPLSKGLQEIHRVLKPGGRCLCLEWEQKQMEQGPPLHHRIHSSEMKKAIEDTGFTNINLIFPTDLHYIITFQK